MQYSYESWTSIQPVPIPDEPNDSPPVSADLKELESSLSMTLEEAMLPNVPTVTVENRLLHAYLQSQSSLQAQLEKLWQIADVHYQDNKSLAAQIQHLLSEREQLLTTLKAYELEQGRFQHLIGNIYLKH